MNAFFKNVLATVIAAAIIGNATMLYNFGERLSRIEAKLEALTTTHIATK